MEDTTYNGWSNRSTWAMGLNLGSDYDLYQTCETLARAASAGNEEDLDAFHSDLAEALELLGTHLVDNMPGMLPDFDPSGHLSPDPKDPHGPDDISEVNWREIAEGYVLSDYV